ncbi:MAG: DUF1552 domain-containing protein [Verrucomicrobiota bacterium]
MNTVSRRSFLRGASGAVLSLPWLESLAVTPVTKTAAPAQRIAWFYVPIGVVRRGFFPGEAKTKIPVFQGGNNRRGFVASEIETPVGENPFPFTPTLEPLECVVDKVTLVTGMDRTYQVGTDVHAQCASCFLSSAPAYSIKESAWPLDRTLDHVIADMVGDKTPFRSLEFSCNSHKDNKESIHFDNISWYGTGHVAPSLRDPRKAYHRLFGTQEIEAYRNITELVLDDARSMKRHLGYADGQKFAEYFDSIRAIEEQMEKMENLRGSLAKVKMDEPAEAHLPRGEYIRLMGDLMVVALQSGLTNVATFMVGPERWDTPFMYESLFDKPVSHHKMSHNQTKYIEQLLEVDRFHMEQFVYLVEKMESIEEANGTSLLDNTILTYGSGLGDGSTHQYNDLPIIVAGRGTSGSMAGKHLHCAEGTPLANLWLTQAHAMGGPQDRFADSTGVVGSLLG